MKIVIYGAGRHAELTHYFFTHDSPHEVVAFCVDAAYLPSANATFMGLPLVAFEEMSNCYPPSDYHLHVALGQVQARQQIFESTKARGYRFASYISTRADIWPDLVVGENAFIDPSAMVHPYVTLGDNVMVIGCIVGHHSVVGSHVLISGAILGGSVTVGNSTFIGMGAIIHEKTTIGQHNIIGSCALITQDTEDNAVYTGQAAKKRLVTTDRVSLFQR
ncbi:sugar O-acyltransferase (sialic acid O-acetyltransferase NeuD family) [Hymenobacter sp. UYAg731]